MAGVGSGVWRPWKVRGEAVRLGALSAKKSIVLVDAPDSEAVAGLAFTDEERAATAPAALPVELLA